jgi:hypothetical protein
MKKKSPAVTIKRPLGRPTVCWMPPLKWWMPASLALVASSPA